VAEFLFQDGCADRCHAPKYRHIASILQGEKDGRWTHLIDASFFDRINRIERIERIERGYRIFSILFIL
jgi:hypothetical protein